MNTYRSPVRLYIREDGENLAGPDVKQAWFAKDSTAASTCQRLRRSRDDLANRGPSFGYYPRNSKMYLVVKPEFQKIGKEAFAGTYINITTHGKRHPGTAIGSRTFTEEFAIVSIKWKVGPKTYLEKL